MSAAVDQGRRLLVALRAYSLVLIGLHLLAPVLAEEQAWGLWPYTYLSPPWRWLLASLAALSCVPPVADLAIRSLRQLVTNYRPPITSRISRHALFALIALVAVIPFLLFRIVHTRWGDAFILVNGIAFADEALRITGTWQAPLDVWLHVQLWRAGSALFGWTDAWPAYRILSPLAGAVYVYVLLRLADSIGQDRAEKWVIVGLMGTLGTMQLFFGYAENYVLAAVGVLLFLWLALEAMRGRRPLWQPALALALTNGLHPSTIVLDPALLFVGWVWARGKGRGGWLQAAAQIAVPMVAVAAGVILLMEATGHGLATMFTTDRPGGGDARFFVPLTEVSTRWERYTMFSWAHLRDWLNEQLLTAPVTLGALALVAVSLLVGRRSAPVGEKGNLAWGDSSPKKAEITFLVLCTALYWLFVFVWNPDYGGQRDWDLFSLAAIPSTLLLARLLPVALRDRQQLAQAGLMLTAVSALHTAAWIYQNTLPWEWS